ncbi:hypothetical protein MHU86_17642 [Fragilaria crotonensis]|nr:hypothetical protein MHU86_17642 [Fragilaria crotonensis]
MCIPSWSITKGVSVARLPIRASSRLWDTCIKSYDHHEMGKPAKLGKRIGTFVARRRLSKRTERTGAETSSSRRRRQAADLDDDDDTENDSDEGAGDLGDEEQDSNDETDVRDEDSDDHYEVDDDSDYDEAE